MEGRMIAALLFYSSAVGLFYILISHSYFKDDPVAKETILRHTAGFSFSAGILAFLAGVISLAYGGGNALYSYRLIALLVMTLSLLAMVPGCWFIARKSHSGIARISGLERCVGIAIISGMIAYTMQIVATEIGTGGSVRALLASLIFAPPVAFFLMLIWASFIKRFNGGS